VLPVGPVRVVSVSAWCGHRRNYATIVVTRIRRALPNVPW